MKATGTTRNGKTVRTVQVDKPKPTPKPTPKPKED